LLHSFAALSLVLSLALWCGASASAQGGHQAGHQAGHGLIPGTSYSELAEPQGVEAAPGTVEVIEFLWYDCQTCFVVEPALERWAQGRAGDITLRRLPAMIGGHMAYYARAFFAAEALGIHDRIHLPLYNALHRHGRALDREEELAAFFAEHGVDRARFLSVFRSSAVAGRVRGAQNASRRYELIGAPSFIVNGKYRVDASMAANVEALLQTVDALVERELAAIRKP
jgi:thiol:disulfide interchange protein DsbA